MKAYILAYYNYYIQTWEIRSFLAFSTLGKIGFLRNRIDDFFFGGFSRCNTIANGGLTTMSRVMPIKLSASLRRKDGGFVGNCWIPRIKIP